MPRLRQTLWAPVLAATLAVFLAARPGLATPPRPFAEGESHSYQVRIGRVGKGVGTLSVSKAVPIRDEPVLLLEMKVEARVGPFKVLHHSRSWLSQKRMSVLRYQVKESTPLGSLDEDFEIYPEGCHFKSKDFSGECNTDEPLDELAYMYFLRTLELNKDGPQEFSRHFNPARNPARLQVQGQEKVSVPAGEFESTVVDFKVIDPERMGGTGQMRLYFTRDLKRVPVRIESKVPFFGQMVLELLPDGSEES